MIARTARVETAPNPMKASTEIRYRVVDSQPIRLAIVDASGREVRRKVWTDLTIGSGGNAPFEGQTKFPEFEVNLSIEEFERSC